MPTVDVDPAMASRLAHAVLKNTLRVKRGENVIIESWTHMVPFARAFVVEARKLGAKPIVLYEDDQAYWDSLESGDVKALGIPGDHEWAALEKADVYVFFWGPEDRVRFRRLGGRTTAALNAYNHRWYKIAEKRKIRGARMEIARATAPNAMEWGLDPGTWQKGLIEASLVDPRGMVRDAARLGKILEKGKVVTISHPNGTNLTLHLKKRPARREDGLVDEKDARDGWGMTDVPTGSVAVAVDETFAEGTFIANRPSTLRGGQATGGRFTFERGKLRSAAFRTNAELFSGPYNAAGPGRDRPGILAIGLNPSVYQAPWLEEYERGVVTLYVGGNSVYGGSTKAPYLSWLSLAEATLEVDGKPLLRAGGQQ